MPGAAGLVARWSELLEAMMAEGTPLTAHDMARAGAMPWEHRGPFDRMIVAQAQLRGLRVVTRDAAILGFREVDCADWA